MRDLDKFPAEDNLRGRDHCLNDNIDKDNIDIAIFNTTYPIDRSDKCRGNLHGVASLGANITKQPWYNCQGQGHLMDPNQKNRKELANGRVTSQKCENLHAAMAYNKTEGSVTTEKKNAGRNSKDSDVSILPRNQSKNGNLQMENIAEDNREESKCFQQMDHQVQMEKDPSPKDKEHLTKKEPKRLVVCRGEKQDKEKRNKSDIDRKNEAKQLRLR